MFGFIRGDRDDRQYRTLYARACQSHFTNNGRLASLFHSYEAVFLYALACDLDLIAAPQADDPTCCRLRRRFETSAEELEVGRFCAAFAMLLLRTKLQDDWKDDRSLSSLLGLRLFRRPMNAAMGYLRSIDPMFDERLESILAKHESLESLPSSLATLSQFQAATREGFGYVFSLFAQRFLTPEKRSAVEQIGQCLGEAIIAFDCAVDWKSDQKRKRFNPLKNVQQVQQSLIDCSRGLIRATQALASMTTKDRTQVVTQRVLEQQIRMVLRRANALSVELRQTACLSKTEIASGQSLIALRRGDCDICCAIEACDTCACDAAVCDALACKAGSSSCLEGIYCYDCCCWGSDCYSSKNKKGENQSEGKAGPSQGSSSVASNSERYRSLVGMKGRTRGDLNMTGLVSIGDQYYPATSWTGSMIQSDTDVLVVDADTFGLRVKEISGNSF